MTLEQIATEMRQIAVQHPFDPLSGQLISRRHFREVTVEGFQVKIGFTLTRLQQKQVYQLSIGHPTGHLFSVPEYVIDKIRLAFFPESGGRPIPSVLRNTRQFIQIL